MNMYGMEKVTRAHIDQMRRETQDTHLLRNAAQAGDQGQTPGGRRMYIAAAGVVLAALLVAFLLLSVASL